MTTSDTKFLKSLFAALMIGLFAFAVAAPVTIDTGSLTVKSAFAAKGSGKDGNGGGGGTDGADDGTADQGGGNDDDAPDAPDGAADDDGTADQGPGDN